MDYLGLGDEIDYDKYNALVYLLRKFKRLTSDLRLGNNTISSDYGTYTFTGGLVNVDGNYIIESPVTITSNDVLLNCFYSFNFTVIDVNTSGVVNRRVVTITGDTGDDGVLSITIPAELIESDEVILPNFKVDIVFDEHEYYTPMAALNIALSVEKQYIVAGETNTITATVTDESGTAKSGVLLGFDVNGTVTSATTGDDGKASITYTGLGTVGKVTVTVSQVSIVFYDGGVTIINNRSLIVLGNVYGAHWLHSDDDVLIDWGDGTQDTVNNPTEPLRHWFSGDPPYTVTFIGDIDTVGDYCFSGNGYIPSIVIPSGVRTIGIQCCRYCPDLESVIIPDSVINIGDKCFYECDNLVDYQLYWTGNNIIQYDSYKMPNNTNTIFTIPTGETSNYIAKNYPSDKLQERGGSLTPTTLTLSSNGDINVGESVTLSGTLLDDDNNGVSGASVEIYQDSVLLDSVTTDSNGEYSKTVSSLSAGSYNFKSEYDGDSTYDSSESSVVSVTVHDYSLTLTGTAIIQTGDSDTITATLLDDGVAVAGVTLDYEIKHGSTTISTGTTSATDSNGQATISYTGTGAGDIDVIVSKSSMSLQETFVLEDLIMYDDASSDKTNSYNATNTSLTFDTDHYVSVSNTTSSASNYIALIEPKNMPTLSNFRITCDIKPVSGTGHNGLNYIDAITTVSGSQKVIELISAYNNGMKGVVIRNPNFNISNRVNGALSTNTWYTFSLEFNGNSFTAKITDSNNSDVYSRTITDSVVQYLEHMCIYQADASSTIHFKNLKIKAL